MGTEEVKEGENRRGDYKKLTPLTWPLIMIDLYSMNHSNKTPFSPSHRHTQATDKWKKINHIIQLNQTSIYIIGKTAPLFRAF